MSEQYYLTRDDLLLLLAPVSRDFVVPAKPRRPFLTWSGLIGASLVVATLNVPVIWNLAHQNAPLPALAPVIAASTSKLASTPAAASQPNTPAQPTPEPAADRLQIASLSIDAPIIWESDYTSQSLLQNLRNGTVHLKGSALPGQNGTTIITGHSSYYRWAAGSYKDVFAPLLSAKLGQEIKLARAGVIYTYKISQIYEVTPNRTDLLVSGKTALLRLMTCTPLGSNTRRLIVDAVQVTPDPNTNSSFSGPKLTADTLLATR